MERWPLPREVVRTISKAEGFFTPCPTCHEAHNGTRDSHLSFMDVDEPHGRGYCHFCRPADPARRIIQIRRNTYHDVLRIGDMTKIYDVAQIQQYTINNGKVVFLKPRPQMPKCARWEDGEVQGGRGALCCWDAPSSPA